MDDTISAIATALGVGSIGVIRISGPHSLAIADRLFDGREKLGKENARKLLYGHIRDAKARWWMRCWQCTCPAPIPIPGRMCARSSATEDGKPSRRSCP